MVHFESGRRVRFYKLMPDGVRQRKRELNDYKNVNEAIQAILRLA